MTPAHLTRLWLAVGLVLVFYSTNSWIAGQGGKPVLDMDLIDDRPVTGALIAIFVCTVLLTLLCWIGIAFARKAPQASGWHARMPVIGLEGLDTASPEGKTYQRFFLTLLIGLPVAALVYFTDQVMGARVFDHDMPGARLQPLDPVSLSTIFSDGYWDHRFRIGEDAEKAVTWFPVLEPMLIGLLLLLAAVSVLLFLRVLFSPRAAPRRS